MEFLGKEPKHKHVSCSCMVLAEAAAICREIFPHLFSRWPAYIGAARGLAGTRPQAPGRIS